jgi:hypothetical protein
MHKTQIIIAVFVMATLLVFGACAPEAETVTKTVTQPATTVTTTVSQGATTVTKTVTQPATTVTKTVTGTTTTPTTTTPTTTTPTTTTPTTTKPTTTTPKPTEVIIPPGATPIEEVPVELPKSPDGKLEIVSIGFDTEAQAGWIFKGAVKNVSSSAVKAKVTVEIYHEDGHYIETGEYQTFNIEPGATAPYRVPTIYRMTEDVASYIMEVVTVS